MDTREKLCYILLIAIAPLIFCLLMHNIMTTEAYRALLCTSALFWIINFIVMLREKYEGSLILRIVITFLILFMAVASFFSVEILYSNYSVYLIVITLINLVFYFVEVMMNKKS